MRNSLGSKPLCIALPPMSFELKERIDLMLQSAFFAGLSAAECRLFAVNARPQIFARDEFLFRQDEPFRRLVLLSYGCVKLTHLGHEGSEVILGLRGPRDVVDLPVGLPIYEHKISAQVMVKSGALTWGRLATEELLIRMPKLNGNICFLLAQLRAERRDRYYEIVTEKVDRRLAWTLFRLAAQIGKPVAQGMEIAISRQELAQMCGTTLFTVSRLISRWADLGLVVPRREAVLLVVLDEPRFMSALEDVSLHHETATGCAAATCGGATSNGFQFNPSKDNPLEAKTLLGSSRTLVPGRTED